jgi:hypothetical protein
MNLLRRIFFILLINHIVDSFLICEKFQMNMINNDGLEITGIHDFLNFECSFDEINQKVILKVTDKSRKHFKVDEKIHIFLFDENDKPVKYEFENLLNEVEVKDDKSTTRKSVNSNSILQNYYQITNYIRLSFILLTCIIMLIAIIVARRNQSTGRYFIKPTLPIYRNLA